MANMLMENDLVSVAYPNDTSFPGLVVTTLGRKALIKHWQNACVIEFTCMADGERWLDEHKQITRIRVLTLDQFVMSAKNKGLARMFNRLEPAEVRL